MKTFRKKLLEKSPAKAQSAMEYLMTYGWAILIISIVLAALFQLGVFNPMAFAPKAQPGACQVFRPNGPGTISFINLEGICSGELPQYVAQFNGNGRIIANVNGLPILAQPRTVTAWFNGNNYANGGGGNIFMYGVGSCPYYWFSSDVGQYNDQLEVNTCNSNQAFTPLLSAGQWYFVAFEYNGSAQIGYFGDGGTLYKVSAAFTANTASSQFNIGYGFDPPGYWSGLISNVQVYNTALSANDIQALYLEGIGGAPINLQHLVGWWPLNGNANDYSGNGNNGQINNVNFVSNWYSGYTPP